MGKKIGFIGVGTMGKPMAKNLLKAGFEMTTCMHVNPVPVRELEELGAKVASSPKEVAVLSEVVITCLPDAPQVEEVILGPNGILEGATPGSIIIDTSTISPLATQRIAAVVAQKGCKMLDAPMSGGEAGAIAGTLTFMVGGDKTAFEACRDIFEAMGKQIYHVGDVGMGEVLKLCNNLMLGINLLGVCEAFTLGVKAGLKAETLAEVVGVSSGNSAVIERYLPRTILRNQYKPGFMLDLMCKDMGLALQLAKALDIPTLVGSSTGQVLDLVQGMGKGRDDFTVVATLYQDVAGVTIAGKK